MISVTQGQNIRNLIFQNVKRKEYTAHLSAQGDGILSGMGWLKKACENLGIRLKRCQKDGKRIRTSEIIAVLEGTAKQMASAEEELIGWISKASGIATAAWMAKKAAGRNLRVVSGAWKKMPLPIKDLIRQAITNGGIQYRIANKPFLYLDKNYVRMLGGVSKTLRSISNLKGYTVVIQLKGEEHGLPREAVLAAQGGADIIMIDTGRKEDIKRIDLILRAKGLRGGLQIAFGGNIRIDDLKDFRKMPAEIVDIGQAIVDAPLLDFRMDIVGKR
jgi:nicotinate-nucleotide pyrophosphorylase (carboxylating)